MKKILNIGLISLLTCFIISCDPAHSIDIINKTDSNVKVKFILNPKIENYRLKQISKGDSIVFNIEPAIKQKDTVSIYFGIGTWSDNDINELTNSIKSIEIATKDITTIYKSHNSIKNILEKNKEGFYWKTIIKIEIE